jgi:glycosyltransferase involved in cell wall biosynthesis
MTISVIIPVKPGGRVRALAALARATYPAECYEIIVAEGCRPSSQRNQAAHAAQGDILYFLDDDSLIDPANLERLAHHFADPDVAAVGGPSLTPPGDTALQQAFGLTLSSLIGGGAVRNRYRRSGTVRRTDDSELILCNLAFRKTVFIAAGGLDDRLYPNEENELMDRIKADGGALLHDPDLAVQRSQRPTVRAYLRQLFTYGRGRGEQTRISRRCKIVSFLPTIFLVYIVGLAVVRPPWPCWLPLAGYLTGAGCEAVRARAAGFPLVAVLHLFWTLPALHLCYGAGLVVGLLRPRHPAPGNGAGEVTLRMVKHLQDACVAEGAGHMT